MFFQKEHQRFVSQFSVSTNNYLCFILDIASTYCSITKLILAYVTKIYGTSHVILYKFSSFFSIFSIIQIAAYLSALSGPPTHSPPSTLKLFLPTHALHNPNCVYLTQCINYHSCLYCILYSPYDRYFVQENVANVCNLLWITKKIHLTTTQKKHLAGLAFPSILLLYLSIYYVNTLKYLCCIILCCSL